MGSRDLALRYGRGVSGADGDDTFVARRDLFVHKKGSI